MSTNQLYIFSKDTDATATEQGYYYQKLKTLKTWLENRIANTQEVIYCDLEDDIFQRNFAPRWRTRVACAFVKLTNNLYATNVQDITYVTEIQIKNL